jgi:hypothetical protein
MMNDNFKRYNTLSKSISQLIKQEKYQETLQKFDEMLETALRLTEADKWYVECSNRKIRFLIKFNKWEELKKFREECNQVISRFGDNPFQKHIIWLRVNSRRNAKTR